MNKDDYMMAILDLLFARPHEKAEAKLEATLAMRRHGDDAISYLRAKAIRSDLSRSGKRSLRLAVLIVARDARARGVAGLRT